MSYWIEYQWAAFRESTHSGAKFVVAIEGGSNNVWEKTKRARSWNVGMLGTADQVLRRAVHVAGACEDGGLAPSGRNCSPEAYIRRIRRLIEGNCEAPTFGRWYPSVQLPPDHPAVTYLVAKGCDQRVTTRFGKPLTAIELTDSQRHLVFDVAECFPDLAAWSLASVSGMRRS